MLITISCLPKLKSITLCLTKHRCMTYYSTIYNFRKKIVLITNSLENVFFSDSNKYAIDYFKSR